MSQSCLLVTGTKAGVYGTVHVVDSGTCHVHLSPSPFPGALEVPKLNWLTTDLGPKSPFKWPLPACCSRQPPHDPECRSRVSAGSPTCRASCLCTVLCPHFESEGENDQPLRHLKAPTGPCWMLGRLRQRSKIGLNFKLPVRSLPRVLKGPPGERRSLEAKVLLLPRTESTPSNRSRIHF